MDSLRKKFEKEKQYPSWNCNDTVIMEYIEWLEKRMQALSISDVNYLLPHYFDASADNDRFCKCGKYLTDDCHKRQL